MIILNADTFETYWKRKVPVILCLYDTNEADVKSIYSPELRLLHLQYNDIKIYAINISLLKSIFKSKTAWLTLDNILLIGVKHVLDIAKKNDINKIKSFFEEIKEKRVINIDKRYKMPSGYKRKTINRNMPILPPQNISPTFITSNIKTSHMGKCIPSQTAMESFYNISSIPEAPAFKIQPNSQSNSIPALDLLKQFVNNLTYRNFTNNFRVITNSLNASKNPINLNSCLTNESCSHNFNKIQQNTNKSHDNLNPDEASVDIIFNTNFRKRSWDIKNYDRIASKKRKLQFKN